MQIDSAGALVSGGASGLGEATVRRLHGAGARVVIADLNREKGEALADLRAGADWARIAAEYFGGEPPSTELGIAERDFWDRRGIV